MLQASEDTLPQAEELLRTSTMLRSGTSSLLRTSPSLRWLRQHLQLGLQRDDRFLRQQLWCHHHLRTQLQQRLQQRLQQWMQHRLWYWRMRRCRSDRSTSCGSGG